MRRNLGGGICVLRNLVQRRKSLNRVVKLIILVAAFTANPVFSDNDVVAKLFKVMSMEEQFASGFDAMLPLIDQMAVQFQLDADGKEELKTIYKDWFNDDIDHSLVISKMSKLYADTFSEEEIVGLIEFFETPIGKKFLDESPELIKVGAQIGMDAAEAKQAELLARLQPFFEKHNIQ